MNLQFVFDTFMLVVGIISLVCFFPTYLSFCAIPKWLGEKKE